MSFHLFSTSSFTFRLAHARVIVLKRSSRERLMQQYPVLYMLLSYDILGDVSTLYYVKALCPNVRKCYQLYKSYYLIISSSLFANNIIFDYFGFFISQIRFRKLIINSIIYKKVVHKFILIHFYYLALFS